MKKNVVIFLMVCFLLCCFSGCLGKVNDKEQLEQQTYYTVTFNSDGGSEIDSQTVKEGGFIKEPELPIKVDRTASYSFCGWYYGEDLWNFSEDTVQSNMILMAKWRVVEQWSEPVPIR